MTDIVNADEVTGGKNTLEPVQEPKTILGWFRKAVPQPTQQNMQSQLGCILEEVSELLESVVINSDNSNYNNDMRVLHICRKNLNVLSEGIKEGKVVISFSYMKNSVNVLDALCDIGVTVRGLGYMMGHDYDGAIAEVNRSNWSKFDADGNPVFNENKKIIKGPNYTKPYLQPYLVMQKPKPEPVIGVDMASDNGDEIEAV